jgi:hypothetical protein
VTIRRIDPWSILKFGFVANLVLLGIQLLAGAVVWYVVQRLELIETVCELAATVGFTECGVDGGALFDTFLVLGLLGVVIQTGILVFLAFLANLIFDLTGGIGLTLEASGPAPVRPSGGATGARAQASAAVANARARAGSNADDTPQQRDETTQIPTSSSKDKSDDDTLFSGS